jgi:hypothetical protein
LFFNPAAVKTVKTTYDGRESSGVISGGRRNASTIGQISSLTNFAICSRLGRSPGNFWPNQAVISSMASDFAAGKPNSHHRCRYA